MTPRPNLNELSKIVFEDNRKKGFHEEEYSDEHYLMLVITELSEAVEADRKGKRADVESFNFTNDVSSFIPSRLFIDAFCENIKDTVEDELCDAVIRLLDFAGERRVDAQWLIEQAKESSISDAISVFDECKTLAEKIFILVSYLSRHNSYNSVVKGGISSIEALCKHLNIDLWLHVDLKLRYNRTREYKHGKNY